MSLVRLERAEVRKLTSSWMAPGIALGAVAFVLLGAVSQLLIDGTDAAQDSGLSLAEPDQLRGVLAAASGGYLFAIVLGTVLMTGEFRHGTITGVFLGEPRRGRVLVAKIVGSGFVGLALGIFLTAIVFVIAVPWLAAKGYDTRLGEAETWRVVVGSWGTLALWCPVGVAIGALIRNQIAAILAVIGWFLIVEQVIVALLPSVGRFLLSGAAAAVSGSGNEDLLPWWGGAIVMIGYTVALGIAARFTLRRDIG